MSADPARLECQADPQKSWKRSKVQLKDPVGGGYSTLTGLPLFSSSYRAHWVANESHRSSDLFDRVYWPMMAEFQLQLLLLPIKGKIQAPGSLGTR